MIEKLAIGRIWGDSNDDFFRLFWEYIYDLVLNNVNLSKLVVLKY